METAADEEAEDEEAEEVVLERKFRRGYNCFTHEGALETLTHLNRLTGAGVYRSFTEPYFDSCGIFTDAVILILGTIANLERTRLSGRVQSLASARNRGKRLGRPKKESRMPQELLIFAYRAVVRENSVRLQNQQDTLRPRYLDEFWWGTPKHPLSFGENGVRNYWGPHSFLPTSSCNQSVRSGRF